MDVPELFVIVLLLYAIFLPQAFVLGFLVITGLVLVYSFLMVLASYFYYFTKKEPVLIFVPTRLNSLFITATSIPFCVILNRPFYNSLTNLERDAVIAHEIGHWQQLFFLTFFLCLPAAVFSIWVERFSRWLRVYEKTRPAMRWLLRFANAAEFDADRFAAKQNPKFKAALISSLEKIGNDYITQTRIDKLTKFE